MIEPILGLSLVGPKERMLSFIISCKASIFGDDILCSQRDKIRVVKTICHLVRGNQPFEAKFPSLIFFVSVQLSSHDVMSMKLFCFKTSLLAS
jgi:hypothetical protein